MAQGSVYGAEVVEFVDPITGAQTYQLTHNPTISANLYFENTCFTPDSESVIFASCRSAQRGAPFDLYRASLKTFQLTQLTDCDNLFPRGSLSMDGTRTFFTAGNELRSVHMDTIEEKVLLRIDEATSLHGPSVGGDYIFGWAVFPGDRLIEIFRVKTDGTGYEILSTARVVSHVQASRTGNYVAWMTFTEQNQEQFRVAKADGSDEHFWCEQRWAHTSWVGDTDRLQGTMLPPDHSITWAHPDDDASELICAGPYFWHSAASLDGQWIVSDTNWPDVGLQLIHVESGRYGTLCLSQSSNANPSHPHPSFSPDGRWVIYNSDRTGIGQVYVVEVPERLREELASGNLQKYQRRGRFMI